MTNCLAACLVLSGGVRCCWNIRQAVDDSLWQAGRKREIERDRDRQRKRESLRLQDLRISHFDCGCASFFFLPVLPFFGG